jgi:hypothetical protein
MTKPADDKLGHAKREIKALTGQLKQERAKMTELKEAATDLLNDCINFDERNLTDGILTTLSNCLKSKGLSSAWLLRQKADAVGEAREHMLRDAGRGRGMDVDEANAWLKVKVQHLKDAANKSGCGA